MEPSEYEAQAVAGGLVFLPHACDEWIIGGPAEVRALIEDLQAALAELEVAGRFDKPPDPA